MTSPIETTSPTLFMAPSETDPGWRRVETGETVKTHFQAYLISPPEARWAISSFWSSEGFVNRGRTHYREAVSLGAWLTVAPQLARKVYRRTMNLWRLPTS